MKAAKCPDLEQAISNALRIETLEHFEKRIASLNLEKGSLPAHHPSITHCFEHRLFDKFAVLLRYVRDVNEFKDGMNLLIAACKRGHIEFIRILLAHPNIDVNLTLVDRGTPLYVCTMHPSTEAMKLLLSHPKIEISVPHRPSPCIRAILKDDPEHLRLMISHPSFAPEKEHCPVTGTLLHFAASYQRDKCMRLLLTNGRFDLQARDEKGRTPLHVAVTWARDYGNNKEMHPLIEELIRMDPDTVTLKDHSGRTPLHTATRGGTTRILLSAGASVDEIDNEGQTILCSCTENFTHLGNVTELLSYPAVTFRLDLNDNCCLMRPGNLDAIEIAMVLRPKEFISPKTIPDWFKETHASFMADRKAFTNAMEIKHRLHQLHYWEDLFAAEVFSLIIFHCEGLTALAD